MKKSLILIAAVLIFVLNIHSQVKDSIYSGRVCIIVLTNGFEADGIITAVEQDTIWFRDEFGENRIPKSQIKLLKDVNQERMQEAITEISETETEPGITTACDVYLETGSLFKDVKLLPAGDSDLTILKGEVEKYLTISRIRKIVFPGAGFGTGALIGAGVGFASGLLFALTAPSGGHPDYFARFEGVFVFSLICALPAGLVGGVLGVLLKTDDIYQLPPGSSITKMKRIKYIIQKHKQ